MTGFCTVQDKIALDSLKQWFLTCGEFPTGGEWRSCQAGNDQSDSTEPLLQNLTHHIQMLTYFTNHNHLQTALITKTTNM